MRETSYTDARCWACGEEATHCLAITERSPRIPSFVATLCAACRQRVVDVVFATRRARRAQLPGAPSRRCPAAEGMSQP